MRGLGRVFLVGVLAASGVIAAPTPAHAVFHFISVKELFAGTGGFSDAQYVELQMYAPNQHVVIGHRVLIYNASDQKVGDFAFPLNGTNTNNQATFLAATTQAETLFNVTADLDMTAVIAAAGGAACFVNNSNNTNIDCVAWGNFVDRTGGATNVGLPFSRTEGIPTGATIQRRTDIAGDAAVLDQADDTNSSANDFRFAIPSPDNNSVLQGAGAAPGGALRFDQSTYAFEESIGNATIGAGRAGANAGQIQVTYSTAGGTADATSDYTAASGALTFGDGDASSKTFDVAITSDTVPEPDETVGLKLRNPTGGAVLAPPFDATLTINNDDVDTARPTSRITRPKHRTTYRQRDLRAFKGTGSDDATGVERVQVALRRTMTNGTCRWWTGSGWRRRSCWSRLWKNASGTSTWTYRLARLLPKSRGTTTAYYTAYSRAIDGGGLIETRFTAGRNANRFEIR